MSETVDNEINKEKEKLKLEDTVWLKSVRLSINLVTNMLIVLTVFVCLLYSCSTVVTLFDLHIIFCVLGYQFFMCQGTLVMSQYNSWSMFIKRRHKKHIHWVLQLIAAILVTAGTYIIIRQKTTHFTSIHGKLGLAALVCCLASLFNGFLAMYAYKLSCCLSIFWIKFFHYITGIASIFLATGSLCAGFQYRSFKSWTGYGDILVPALIVLTWLFTILVSLDFWIVTGNKIRSLL